MRAVLFEVLILVIVTLMHIYVFRCAGTIPFLSRLPKRIFFNTGSMLWVFCIVGRFNHHNDIGATAGMLEFAGMNWVAVLFLSSVCLLAVDIILLRGRFLPELMPSFRGAALIAGGALSVIALVQGMRAPEIQKYEVKLPGLSAEMDGTVLVAMSDLHIGSVLGQEWLADRIAQVKAEDPDLVVLLGDIFHGHNGPSGEVMDIMRKISAPLGVYAVLGNHEFHRHGPDTPLMNINRIRVLRNEWVEVQPGLVLSGVDDLTHKRRSGLGGDTVKEALANRPSGATILLSHTPWEAEKAEELGAGLMLSGHTHGGQIWPLGYLARLVYPLIEGRYDVKGMPVIVCIGTGTTGPRMRLWHPGEILRVTLRAS